MIQYQGWEDTKAIIHLINNWEMYNLNLVRDKEYPEFFAFFLNFSREMSGDGIK
jgi:hypothetical protein